MKVWVGLLERCDYTYADDIGELPQYYMETVHVFATEEAAKRWSTETNANNEKAEIVMFEVEQ